MHYIFSGEKALPLLKLYYEAYPNCLTVPGHLGLTPILCEVTRRASTDIVHALLECCPDCASHVAPDGLLP